MRYIEWVFGRKRDNGGHALRRDWGEFVGVIDDLSCTLLVGLFACCNLLHAVKGAAGLEPTNLLSVQCVVQLNLVDRSVRVLDMALNGDTWSELVQSLDGDLVGGSDLID